MSSAELERRHRELKARHDRLRAELRRQQGQGGHFNPAEARGEPAGPRSTTRAFHGENPLPKPPAFYPAAAPPPEASLKAFIAAAEQATSMEQLLGYLPVAEQRVLKERQANYDPKEAARGRAWRRQQDPNVSEETQTYLSNPPYVNELDRYKDIGGKILEVLSVKVEGNRALIEVSTNSGGTFNGVRYPYGTAKIEMVGEGAEWKLASYNDSNVSYLEPPEPKQPKKPAAKP
jgi:hypothetical protein